MTSKYDMDFINEDEECIGRYKTKEKAFIVAQAESLETGKMHHAFLSHYYCPYDNCDKMFWSVMVSRKI